MLNRVFISLGAVSLFLLASCSTQQQVARQDDQGDDVYYSKAKALEEKEKTAKEKPDYVTNEELYGDQNSSYTNSSDYEDGFYDGSYSARLYRFNNYTPWRGYYDSYYDYRFDPYYNNNYYSYNYGYNSRFSYGIYTGLGNPYGYYYNPWQYYGSQYYGSYWGTNSYYNVYNPYSFGGYYGNLYNQPLYTSPNYRPRPVRGAENTLYNGRDRRINDTGSGAIGVDGQGRILDTRSRAERYKENTSNSNGDVSSVRRSSQPAARPARTSENQPRQTDSRKSQSSQQDQSSRTERYTPPPAPEKTSTAPASNNNGNNSRSSEDNKPRPSRSGGK